MLTQQMGLHRDGSKWGLPAEVVEQRRYVIPWSQLSTQTILKISRVFWECSAQDIFQANCSSRP